MSCVNFLIPSSSGRISKAVSLCRMERKKSGALQDWDADLTTETHGLTQTCWAKCMPGAIKGGKLDKNEETCLANCVNRFMDLNFLTVKHLNSMRG